MINMKKKLNTKELIPIYDNVKSYYKKAFYIETKNTKELYSYGMKVAELKIVKENGTHKRIATITSNVTAHLTKTTMRHIKEFLKQNDFIAENKKQILEDYDKDERY